ncbi:MAG: type I DNA topoisomerase [Deltaproteobacteria bacterium]|nr:MAG: type I DNA topoisomerase [Deltaproteobacteria bacterium]
MGKPLIIVESPTKARTLKKFLGPKYNIKSSVGHIKNLPEKSLGVDIENGFSPQYQIIKGKGKVIAEIKKAAKEADAIYLAPDPDREGEAIAWHIQEELKGKKENIYRARFNEFTKKAVLKALENPGRPDENKYNAQKARRVLDRLVGYQISPILWKKVRRGLSAGRVQSVAVRLICEREREIASFVPEEYWTIEVELTGESPPAFTAKLLRIDSKKAEIKDEEGARQIQDSLQDTEFRVAKLEKKERKRYPTPPFITSKLQQEAARKLHFSAKKTMLIAQKLYEGVELGEEGSVGLITYMRTDSPRIADEAMEMVRSYIAGYFGPDYLPDKPVFYKSKKGAQEAHEAIRPTSIEYKPNNIRQYLKKDELALYELIWNRFLASQMKPAIYDQTVVDISAGDYLFRAVGSVMKFPGFISVYIEGEDEPEEEKGGVLPDLKQGEILKLLGIKPEQHFTQPPPRFSESTLIKELEEKGIGRPSTYALILSNILERDYVRKEKGKFIPTELGSLVTDLLVESFPRILNVEFTAEMEEDLDKIEGGEQSWTDSLSKFYQPFEVSLEQAKTSMRDVKKEQVPSDVPCEKCGDKMVIRWGKNGKFLACPNYPKCRYTRELTEEEGGEPAEERTEEELCEKCDRPMVVRSGRYGKFLACSGYPECRNTRPLGKERKEPEVTDEICEKCGGHLVIKKARSGNRFLACENYPKCKNAKAFPIGVECPECGGQLVERGGTKGRVFYGCSNYPSCKFVEGNKPISEDCPQCGSPYLVGKYDKRSEPVVSCPVKECGYSRAGSGEGE